MVISSNYVVVKKAPQQERAGDFNAVEPADDFVYKGEVVALPSQPVHVSDTTLAIGTKVLFAKYSPDTFEMDSKELFATDIGKLKFVKTTDILAITNQ